MKYKHHPLACMFPMMPQAEIGALAEDIKKNGLEDYGIIYEGMILDGRNRQAACELAGVKMEFHDYDEDPEWLAERGFDPLEYVLSRNLHRRQLKQSQRAMVAAKMANIQHGGDRSKPQNCGLATADAAAALSVSSRATETAKHVLAHGSDELIEAVEQCQVSVSLAGKLCKEVPDKAMQTELVQQGKQAIRDYITPPSDFVEDEVEQSPHLVVKTKSPAVAAVALLKHFDVDDLIYALKEASK